VTDRRNWAFVTGAAGQDGLLFSRLLLAEGSRVLGLVRSHEAARRVSRLVPGAEVLTGDVADDHLLRSIVARYGPDVIYNLAGFSSVGQSWYAVDQVSRDNLTAVAQLLEIVREEHAAGGPWNS
jgi:GDPmannose 4,6-dehydratase